MYCPESPTPLASASQELGEFYDMEALAEGSPLWEVEEVEEDWEDVDEDDEAEDEGEEGGGGGPSAEGEAPSWLLAEGAVDFDKLFERALTLGVVSCSTAHPCPMAVVGALEWTRVDQ